MTFIKCIIKQDESISHRFSADDFDLSLSRSRQDSVSLSGGRGGSQKIILQGESYVLRKYIRGGMIAKLSHDQYVWSGLHRSRPYVETRAVDLAIQHHLPVPAVAAYCIRKQGMLYQASIISRFIENRGTLASYLYQHEVADEQWQALGKLIKQMHRAGIFHADLNANNILIGESREFYLIDFDKARIIPSLGGMGEDNIQRLLRSLNKIQQLREQQHFTFHFNSEHWQILLDAYAK